MTHLSVEFIQNHFMLEEQNKDTLLSEAPNGTPSQTETQVSSPEGTAGETAAQKQERIYAGKYKSAEDLEIAYKNIEAKVGNKSYAETIGQKVVEATGYTIKDLEDAGYTPEQIVQAVYTTKPAVDSVTPETKPLQASSLENVRRTVEDSKLERLEWKMGVKDFTSENPLAKEFLDEINDYHAMPQYKDWTPEQIFNSKLKKFVSKGEQAVRAKESEKERATLSVTHAAPPTPKAGQAELERFQKTRHLDDATGFIASWLRGGK